MSSFGGYYDTTDNRYPNQTPYYQSYPSRASSPVPESGVESDRRLPPLSTSSSMTRDERWGTPSYSVVSSTALPNASGGIRSPAASYPHSFTYSNPNPAASYPGFDMPMTDVRHSVQSQSIHQTPGSVLPTDARSDSSYGRPPNPSSYNSPPISPTSAEQEPTIKKKRKRADAAQLKILNETYARTAFPSTEERQALAKELDMSARSVQIW